MNIRKDSAGCVTNKHIQSKGFIIFDTIEGNDMGQMDYSIPQYKNDKYKIVGGYWNWTIQDLNGKKLWEGWWNSNEEFDETLNSL